MASDVMFRFLAENSADIICRFGLDRRLHYVSPASTAILGWTPEEIMAMPPFGVVVAEDVPYLIASIERDLLPDAVPTPIAVRNRRKDGTVIWMEVSPRLVRDPLTGEVTESVIVLRDITNRKLLEERLAELAFTDGLTGLSNRRAFDDAFSQEWEKTLSEGGQMSLILIDVDHFKKFNDRYGHQVGDDCLRSVANALRTVVRRQGDMVARYGGEEFAVILPCTSSPDAVSVAENLRRTIHALRITYPDNAAGACFVTASFGVSTAIARHGGSMKMPEGLLMSADHALYKAKHDGRNRIASTNLMASRQPN